MLNSVIFAGKNLLSKVRREEKGQALVEYALIIALVAVVVIAVLVILGHSVSNTLNNVANSVGGVSG